AFVTDPLFCGMRQRLTAMYGTDFVQLGHGSINTQCHTALEALNADLCSVAGFQFTLWLACPHTTDHFFVNSRTKPHLLWAMMDDSCVSNLAPLLVQVHAMPTGAVSGERDHMTTKRVASAKRSRIGFCSAKRQVAISFDGKQLARVQSA
ncbi:hypothetical protein SPRG_18182, partial [Saprolegnia parasitica CBS 223.65]